MDLLRGVAGEQQQMHGSSPMTKQCAVVVAAVDGSITSLRASVGSLLRVTGGGTCRHVGMQLIHADVAPAGTCVDDGHLAAIEIAVAGHVDTAVGGGCWA